MATPYASMLLETREGEAAAIPVERVHGRAQADRRRSFSNSMPPTARATWSPNNALCGLPGSARSRSPASPPPTRKSRLITTPTRRPMRQGHPRNQPGGGAGPGDRQRHRHRAPRPARRSPPRPPPRAPMRAVTTLTDQSRAGLCRRRRRQGGGGGVRAPPQARWSGRSSPISAGSSPRSNSMKTGGGKTLDQARGRNRRQAHRRQAQARDRGSRRQGPDRGRRRQQFQRSGGRGQAFGDDYAVDHGHGTARADPAFKLPPELAPALKTGFEIAANDPPEIVALNGDAGYAMVSPGEVVPAAPAPLASIRDRVAGDWINEQATQPRQGGGDRQSRPRRAAASRLPRRSRSAGVALPAGPPVQRAADPDRDGTRPGAAGDANACSPSRQGKAR